MYYGDTPQPGASSSPPGPVHPCGAQVSLNGEILGTAPFTVFYDPLAKFNLSVTKEGFRPALFGEGSGSRPIDFTKDWMVPSLLERIPAWIFDAKAPVECTPLVLGDRIFLGPGGPDLLPRPRERRAPVELRYPRRLGCGLRDPGPRGPPLLRDLRRGFPHPRREDRKAPPSPLPLLPPRPIRHPASEPEADGTVAVNCGGAAISAVKLGGGTLLWTVRSESEVIGPPEIHRARSSPSPPTGRSAPSTPEPAPRSAGSPCGSPYRRPGRRATAPTSSRM